MATVRQLARRERVIAEIMQERAIQDVACELGAQRMAALAALQANEQQMRALACSASRGQISTLADCLKVSRQSVHRWRKNDGKD